MTEILTESFCERCGTRYTFESAAPQRSRFNRVRVLAKGARNFVLSDETTLSEAMADARSETELQTTSQQLDAFHKTFNFCLTCRQYTCGNCWNEADGRCRTCAPMDEDVAAAAQLELEATRAALIPDLAPHNGHATDELAIEDSAWPTIDLPTDRLARALGDDELEAGVPEPGAASVDDGVSAETPVWPVAEVEDEAAATIETEPVAPPAFAPGQSLDDAIAAYEAGLAAAEAAAIETGPTPEAGAEPDVRGIATERGVPTRDDAIAAVAAEADDHPLAAEATERVDESHVHDLAAARHAEPEAFVEPAVPEVAAEPVEAAATEEPIRRDDIVAQPTWPVPAVPPAAVPPAEIPAPVVPAAPPPAAPTPSPWLTVAPDPSTSENPAVGPAAASPSDPQWPAAPQWPGAGSRGFDAPRMLAGRPLVEPAAAGFWAASSREVLARPPASAPSPQSCANCGLSLSATARFCRRCGTRQG